MNFVEKFLEMVRMAKAGHPGRALVNERTTESRNLMNPRVQASSVKHEKQQGRNQHSESGLLRLASSNIFEAIRPCLEEQLGEIPSCCELVPTLKLFEVELHYLGNDVRGKVQPDENRDPANLVLLSLRFLQKTESPQGRFF